jgi:hypothetical protein
MGFFLKKKSIFVFAVSFFWKRYAARFGHFVPTPEDLPEDVPREEATPTFSIITVKKEEATPPLKWHDASVRHEACALVPSFAFEKFFFHLFFRAHSKNFCRSSCCCVVFFWGRRKMWGHWSLFRPRPLWHLAPSFHCLFKPVAWHRQVSKAGRAL